MPVLHRGSAVPKGESLIFSMPQNFEEGTDNRSIELFKECNKSYLKKNSGPKEISVINQTLPHLPDNRKRCNWSRCYF